MMGRTEIRVAGRAAASLQTTWSTLADQVGMSNWAPVTVTLERQGDPPPDGAGAIRVVTRWPLRVREQITDVEAPSRLAYRLLSGFPVQDYVAETVLTERDQSTEITWTVSMTARVPGTAFVVRCVIRALVHGLVLASEQTARSDKPTQ